MKKAILLTGLVLGLISCEERTEKMENSRGIPGPEKVEVLSPSIDDQERELQQQGFQTQRRQKGDSTYLMQQYYVVFLKDGETEVQDTTEIAELQKQQDLYLNKLAQEGSAILAGSMGDTSEISEMIIFRTPNHAKADSLVQENPMVRAGVLRAEVHPWWVNTGATFN